MKFCRKDNRNYTEECPGCRARDERKAKLEASRNEFRRRHRQTYARCHDCWNLAPWCVCRGGWSPSIAQIQRSINEQEFERLRDQMLSPHRYHYTDIPEDVRRDLTD